MVDTFKVSKMVPSLSPARKVVRADSRGRQRQGKPFKESLERKQKKKEKEIPADGRPPDSEITLKIVPPRRQADIKIDDRCSQAGKSVRRKLIDIRV